MQQSPFGRRFEPIGTLPESTGSWRGLRRSEPRRGKVCVACPEIATESGIVADLLAPKGGFRTETAPSGGHPNTSAFGRGWLFAPVNGYEEAYPTRLIP